MLQLKTELDKTKPKVLADPVTDPIPQLLADTLETWFWSHYTKEEVKAELLKSVRPKNANACIPVKIDQEVYRALKSLGHAMDTPNRYIQNALGKGMLPLISVWATILKCETALKKYNPDKSTEIQITLSLTIDFYKLRQMMDLGLCLLGIANLQLAIKRRLNIRPFITSGVQRLCTENQPFNQWYFGGNVKASIDDTSKINHMVEQSRRGDSSQKFKKYNKFSGKQNFLGKGHQGPAGHYQGGSSKGGNNFYKGGKGRGKKTFNNNSQNYQGKQSNQTSKKQTKY